MKISKLFHWLYVIVMLLPIFAIGSTCLIGIFNENAYTTKEVIYESTNEVNSLSDIDENSYYYVDIDNNILNTIFDTSYEATIAIEMYSLDYFYFFDNQGVVIDDTLLNINETQFNNKTICTIIYDYSSLFESFYVSFNNYEHNYISIDMTNLISSNVIIRGVCKLIFEGNVVANQLVFYECPQDKLPIKEVVEKDTYDIFYYSIDKVVESPLFNWAYNSFLVTPFSYIANVFSMPVNSPIVMLLSYWLAISVIWLVFDLIMYVPLLVHSWIDRGMVK